jgi:RNA polymerase sigma-70 factor (ECF subfamily)
VDAVVALPLPISRGDPLNETLSFEAVYRAELGFVWRSARALGVSDGAIDDIVQEIFVVAHRRLPEMDGRSIRAWLSRILLNVVRHHRRSIVRKSPHALEKGDPVDVDALEGDGPTPSERFAASQEARLLRQILGDLDEKKREVLVLSELEELTAPEIAEALGINLNTVYSRLRLAREEFDRVAARYRAREKRYPR